MAREHSLDEALHTEELVVDDYELFEDRRPLPREPRARARSSTPPGSLPPLPPPPYSKIAQSVRGSGQPCASDGEIREGDVLAGRYAVVRSLGKAGIGAVLLVRHLELDQHFVLKYLPRSACAYPDTVARFLKGARGARHLTSEHTERTVDAGRLDSGVPYVVSEFLEGTSLRDMLPMRGGLPISDAVDMILQTAAAIAEAHRHGFAHGALTPSTLFVAQAPDGAPLVKVMEFGVGNALRANPLLGTDTPNGGDPHRAIESLSCTAPEQIRRAGDLDARTDVWALGALLYEALTGFPVYYSDDVAALLAMIVADPPPVLTLHRPDAPAALEQVILRCLEKEPSARFASVAELAVALKFFASPDSQSLADRVTRTLGRSSSPVTYTRAVVHVPSTPPPPPASPTAAPREPVIAGHRALSSAGLLALGLFGGTVVGAIVTRSAPPPAITVISPPVPPPTSPPLAQSAQSPPPPTIAVAAPPAEPASDALALQAASGKARAAPVAPRVENPTLQRRQRGRRELNEDRWGRVTEQTRSKDSPAPGASDDESLSLFDSVR